MDTGKRDSPADQLGTAVPTEEGYRERLRQTHVGKHIGDRVYLHVTALSADLKPVVRRATVVAEVGDDRFNVVRFSKTQNRLSLLHYPTLFTEAFPALAASWTVDLAAESVQAREYASATAPILHRKELLLPPDHARYSEFEQLTEKAAAHGLFDDSRIIGMRVTWEEELRARGLRVDGHDLVPLGSADVAFPEVLRHRTALSRTRLSGPMSALWRHGFLGGDHQVFDYGCGRGDDLELLGKRGVPAAGWDPHFRPEDERTPAGVVNLGFVLNVIEDPAERRDALRGAYRLTRHVLAIAALIGGRTAYERHRLFRDGVLTSRNTFQKYFRHAELGEYIEEVLGREPVSIAPGIYFVFPEDAAEQDFLERRQKTPRAPTQPSKRARIGRPSRSKRANLLEQHGERMQALWDRCLELGRMPHEDEFGDLPALAKLMGSPKRLLADLVRQHGTGPLETAAEHRREDLSVYLALAKFGRRRSFKALPERLQRDVRVLWGSYTRAQEAAMSLLFSIADEECVVAACETAAEGGLGHFSQRETLQLHSSLVGRLAPILRVLVGCVSRLAGEPEEADVIRIHARKGSITFVICDDFEGQRIPSVLETVWVHLARQKVRVRDYGEERTPPPLMFKSRR